MQTCPMWTGRYISERCRWSSYNCWCFLSLLATEIKSQIDDRLWNLISRIVKLCLPRALPPCMHTGNRSSSRSAALEGRPMMEVTGGVVAGVQCQGWTRRTRTYCRRLCSDVFVSHARPRCVPPQRDHNRMNPCHFHQQAVNHSSLFIVSHNYYMN